MSINPSRIALQLYTLRVAAAADFLGTLRRVAEIGYPAVEFAGFGPVSPADLRVELDVLGLTPAAAHVPLAQWQARPEGVVADLQTIGCGWAVVPYVPEEERGGLVWARKLAADLNRWGALCRENGLRFAYHHHAFEFENLPDGSGVNLFEVILTQCDPDNVAIELDVYWARRGEGDPAELLARLGKRAPLVHMKDLGPAPDRDTLPVGDGVLRWDRIVPAAEAAGVEWYIVEQDHSPDPFADVATSLAALRKM